MRAHGFRNHGDRVDAQDSERYGYRILVSYIFVYAVLCVRTTKMYSYVTTYDLRKVNKNTLHGFFLVGRKIRELTFRL